jgi:hypothetical protein
MTYISNFTYLINIIFTLIFTPLKSTYLTYITTTLASLILILIILTKNLLDSFSNKAISIL